MNKVKLTKEDFILAFWQITIGLLFCFLFALILKAMWISIKFGWNLL